MLTHHSGFRLRAQTPAKRLKFDAIYGLNWSNKTKIAAIAALFVLSDCYIKNSIPEGVIVPTFELYIRAGIRDLVQNQISRGIDKNFAQVASTGTSRVWFPSSSFRLRRNGLKIGPK